MLWGWVFPACAAGLSCSSTKDWYLKTALQQLSYFHSRLSLFLPVSFGLSPLWSYSNCLLQNWSLQPDSLSSLTIHRLSLDFNLSQNQSHSQATQPFCIPTSLCFGVRIQMPAECQWETWLLFQLCCISGGQQIIYLHNICKVVLHCLGAF